MSHVCNEKRKNTMGIAVPVCSGHKAHKWISCGYVISETKNGRRKGSLPNNLYFVGKVVSLEKAEEEKMYLSITGATVPPFCRQIIIIMYPKFCRRPPMAPHAYEC